MEGQEVEARVSDGSSNIPDMSFVHPVSVVRSTIRRKREKVESARAQRAVRRQGK